MEAQRTPGVSSSVDASDGLVKAIVCAVRSTDTSDDYRAAEQLAIVIRQLIDARIGAYIEKVAP